MEKERVSFDLDGLIGLLRAIVDGVLSLFHPILSGLEKIAGESQVGFLIVFVIFFIIFLARTGARTKNMADFSATIGGVGRFGMKWSAIYTLVMVIEVFLMPLFVTFFILGMNSLTGNAPGFGRFFELLFSHRETGERLIADIVGVYVDPGRIITPLGFRATSLVFACFGCMYLVGRVFSQSVKAPSG